MLPVPRTPFPGETLFRLLPEHTFLGAQFLQIGWQYEGAAERVHRHILLDRSHLNAGQMPFLRAHQIQRCLQPRLLAAIPVDVQQDRFHGISPFRSEEHTSELQSLMRISYAVFCLKKKTYNIRVYTTLTDNSN